MNTFKIPSRLLGQFVNWEIGLQRSGPSLMYVQRVQKSALQARTDNRHKLVHERGRVHVVQPAEVR